MILVAILGRDIIDLKNGSSQINLEKWKVLNLKSFQYTIKGEDHEC